jgi:hypothetical protein
MIPHSGISIPFSAFRITAPLLLTKRPEFVVRVPGEKVRDECEITNWGEKYLSGEIDAEHRKPRPSPRPPDKVRPSWYAGFG